MGQNNNGITMPKLRQMPRTTKLPCFLRDPEMLTAAIRSLDRLVIRVLTRHPRKLRAAKTA